MPMPKVCSGDFAERWSAHRCIEMSAGNIKMACRKAPYHRCRQCYGLTYESCQKSHKYDRVKEHLDRLDEDNLTINQVLRLSGL